MSRDPLLTETELGALLQIPQKTLQRWRWIGKGPQFVKLPSGAVRYEPAAVEKLIAASRRRSTSDRGSRDGAQT